MVKIIKTVKNYIMQRAVSLSASVMRGMRQAAQMTNTAFFLAKSRWNVFIQWLGQLGIFTKRIWSAISCQVSLLPERLKSSAKIGVILLAISFIFGCFSLLLPWFENPSVWLSWIALIFFIYALVTSSTMKLIWRQLIIPRLNFIAGIGLLVAGLLIGFYGFNLLFAEEWLFRDVIREFYANASTELISIAITVLIIDYLNKLRQDKQLKNQLIREMGGSDNSFAQRAVRELAHHGWLSDGSLEGVYLKKASLEQIDDLRGVNLKKAFLPECNFEGSNLTEANLQEALLHKANLNEANLSKAILIEANLLQSSLVKANLEETDLGSACLLNTDLTEANLEKANLKGADLRGVNLKWADLRGVQIDDRTQIDQKWRLVCKIMNQEAVIQNLEKVDLEEANLRGVNLSGANLRGANLREANLNGYFYRAFIPRDGVTDLSGANLSEANLSRARLGYVDLKGANLKKANLQEANPYGCYPADHPVLECRINLEDANLIAADLEEANLRGSNLRKANLVRACLRKTILAEANLEGVILKDTDFSGALYDKNTVWPDKFNPQEAGAILIEDIPATDPAVLKLLNLLKESS